MLYASGVEVEGHSGSVMVCFANVVHYFDGYDSEMTYIHFVREGIISVLIMSLHKEHPV